MSQKTVLPENEAGEIDLLRAAEPAPATIVSRTLVQSPEMRVVLFAFADGQELTAHASPRRALAQVIEGACEFLFSGSWHRVAAGALVHLPPGHTHAVRASGGAFKMLLTLGGE